MYHFARFPLLLISLLIPLIVQAELSEQSKFYYEPGLSSLEREPLKVGLHKTLNSFHLSQNQGPDKIVSNCSTVAEQKCYRHKRLSYRKAREFMFGYLYLEENTPGLYSVKSVYCEQHISNEQLPSSKQLGPMKIPDANVINTEHAWPQSHFSHNFPKSTQKSDLHALYPVKMQVNSMRGNNPFGEVSEVIKVACDGAALGRDHNNTVVFEPIDKIKGNIARSLFYFSIRYNIRIDKDQEKVLRKWHENDPRR